MSRKYQKYTDEFKQEAARLVTEQGHKVARRLGVWPLDPCGFE
jgi:transposase-like protein